MDKLDEARKTSNEISREKEEGLINFLHGNNINRKDKKHITSTSEDSFDIK